MPKTRLISPGIANHSLKKNLILNHNYISNDGGDEGISIADDGDITLTSNDTQLKIAYDATNYVTHAIAADGALTITTVDADAEEADIILVPNGEVKIDRNSLSTTLQTTKGLEIDYDHTGSTGTAQTMIGLDIDALSNLTTGGNQTLYGAKIKTDLRAASSGAGGMVSYGLYAEAIGTQNGATDTATAGYFKASGTNTDVGVHINCLNGGDDFVIQSSASVTDWFKIQVGLLGATTFTTKDYGGSDYEADLTLNIDGKIDINSASGEDITLDAGGNITLDADGGSIYFKDDTTTFATFAKGGSTKLTLGSVGVLHLDSGNDVILDASTGIHRFYLAGDTDDLCTLTVAANGETTLATADSDGAVGHLNIEADGHVEFDNCAVGFDRLEQTFSVTDVIASVGTDDTDIDFRLSNKYRLEMTDDIAQMNLIFPNTSGNFLLVCNTDGDHDVALWKVWEHDSAIGSTNAAAVTDVMWAGGSLPAFTDTGNDIVSFYWDADEQTAYGVASLAFAIPS